MSAAPAPAREATSLRELSPQQWKSGIAAWLGWMFDGLEMHLYTLVAGPLIIGLLGVTRNDPQVNEKSAYVQAAFLLGWAIGGGFFGRLGDKLGRSRALALTVLTYAICTGLCAFAQTWWQLMIFRFIAAVGIGGEWAVGASLLTETWPKSWRPWIAAVLQSGVNIGILIAAGVVWVIMPWLQQVFTPAGHPGFVHDALMAVQGVLPKLAPEHLVFLIGVLPALAVYWIRKHVPEPESWQAAQAGTAPKPGIADLFRGRVASITWRTMVVCALSLSAWWLFMFWQAQHLRRILTSAGVEPAEVTQKVSAAFFFMIAVSIVGNYFAGWLAKLLGNRLAITVLFFCLFGGMFGAFIVPREFGALAWFWIPLVGFFSGVFGLFTMYMPPLFPTLLRTTGAGFCYNIGRTAAAMASIVFGLLAPVNDMRVALLYSSFLALAAAVWGFWLPKDAKDA